MTEQIESRVEQMIAEVVPANWMDSFRKLDLSAKLTGIAFFAQAAGEVEIRDLAIATARAI